MEKIHGTIGHHYIVEASGCDPKIIGCIEKMQQILVKAAEKAGAQVWSISFNRFPPNGVSGVVVISESHISTHTWPEFGYVALDIYTCGEEIDPEKAVEYAVLEFKASISHITEITRGIEEGDKVFYHSFVTWEEDVEEVKPKYVKKVKK
jgi:S-adenosylmethionine decarboxylase